MRTQLTAKYKNMKQLKLMRKQDGKHKGQSCSWSAQVDQHLFSLTELVILITMRAVNLFAAHCGLYAEQFCQFQRLTRDYICLQHWVFSLEVTFFTLSITDLLGLTTQFLDEIEAISANLPVAYKSLSKLVCVSFHWSIRLYAAFVLEEFSVQLDRGNCIPQFFIRLPSLSGRHSRDRVLDQ